MKAPPPSPAPKVEVVEDIEEDEIEEFSSEEHSESAEPSESDVVDDSTSSERPDCAHIFRVCATLEITSPPAPPGPHVDIDLEPKESGFSKVDVRHVVFSFSFNCLTKLVSRCPLDGNRFRHLLGRC